VAAGAGTPRRGRVELVIVVFRTAILSAWLLGIGLLAVSLEAQRIRIGHRIYSLLRQREVLIERVRRLEIRYNRMVSPDLLWRELPDPFLADGRLEVLGKGGARH
jgi:hypothetical protein